MTTATNKGPEVIIHSPSAFKLGQNDILSKLIDYVIKERGEAYSVLHAIPFPEEGDFVLGHEINRRVFQREFDVLEDLLEELYKMRKEL